MRTENAPKLAHFPLWLALGWLLIAVIVALTLMPPPDRVQRFEYEDKIGHLIAYGLLMLWFAQLFIERQARFWYGLAFVALGIVLEFCQGALGYRSFEYADMVANGFGVIAGALLAATGRCNFLFPLDRTLVAVRG